MALAILAADWARRRNATLLCFIVDHGLRAEATVVMYNSSQIELSDEERRNGRPESAERKVLASFALSRCLPLKIKAPALNAKDGLIAVEELQVAYEALELRPPDAKDKQPSSASSDGGTGG